MQPQDLDALYQGCRTYRRFQQKPVDAHIIEHAIDNARIASCSKNAQPLRYIAITSEELVEQVRPLCKYGALLPPEIGMPKQGEHPMAFIAVVKQKAASSFVDFDAGLAVNHITTTLWAHEVGSCIVAAFNKNKAHDLLGISDDEEIYVIVSLGYPAHTSTLVEQGETGSLAYYVDDNRDYYVPKRTLKDVCSFV